MSAPSRKTPDTAVATVRLDKWLWAARFFRTRSLASAAIKGGKVTLDGYRAKPSSTVRAGQRLHVTKGETAFTVDVCDVSARRGPAAQAEQLYTETDASRQKRTEQAAERRVARQTMPRPAGRPDKKQRRQLRRFKHGD